jgi:hypothetical protein
MKRKIYFSFHYDNDLFRANVVRNKDMTSRDDIYGYFDSVPIEKVKKDDKEIKMWIQDQLKNTSVTAVLKGRFTYQRPYVQYEIIQSIIKGNGLLNVEIHNIKDMQKSTIDIIGFNPFDYFFYRIKNEDVNIWVRRYNEINWPSSPTFTLKKYDFKYKVSKTEGKFSEFITTHNYMNDDGYNNLEKWFEFAYLQTH